MSNIIVNNSSETGYEDTETISTEIIVEEEKIESDSTIKTELQSQFEVTNTETIDKESEIKDKVTVSKYRKYACDVCPKLFKQKYVLNQHREEVHNIKRNVCITCGKPFACRATLKRHNIRFHSHSLIEAFPHCCDTCNQRFNSLAKFNDHKTLHTDPDAFKCNICDKTFTNRFALTRHSTRHASVRQVCKTCKKSFATREDLQKHVGIHTGEFWCDVCFKVFPSKGHLTMHKNKHLTEPAYYCKFCGQCFRCKLVRLGHEKLCEKTVAE